MSKQTEKLMVIVDCETNEESFSPLSEHVITVEQEMEKYNIEISQQKKEKQVLIDSAHLKLSALGLTPEEIAAITKAN